MDGIAAFQHTSEFAGLETLVAGRSLAGGVPWQVPGVRLGREAACTLRCEEAAPDTHESGDQAVQEEGSGRAADHLRMVVGDSSLVPVVGVVVDMASAGDRALELPRLAGSGAVENKALAVVGIVRVAAYLEAGHGAYLGSQEEARRVATSSYRAVEVAPAWGKKKLCLRHWEYADY